jgi:SAM-dependent methyltransferase
MPGILPPLRRPAPGPLRRSMSKDGNVAESPVEDAWDELGRRFVDHHYSSLRGRVRTYVIDQHLRAVLAGPPARVVDVGGGAGHQSIPLARDGYRVTIVDPSTAMLARAADRLTAEDPDVGRRVRFIEVAGEDAPEALDGERFDAVLCHGVLMYLDDPEPMVDALCRLATPGGIVSIVAKSVEVLAMRHALEGDWQGALAAFDGDRQINGLGVETRGDSVDALSSMLVDRGVEPIGWYGVRLFTDGWTPDRPATDSEDLVLQVELVASRRDPYRRLSRLFHLLGRRT